jgi:hypothetical protein
MADLFHSDCAGGYIKLNSIITRPQPEMTGQVPPQRLGSAHLRSFLESYQQFQHAAVDRVFQLLELFCRLGRQDDWNHPCSLCFIDANVNGPMLIDTPLPPAGANKNKNSC